MLRYTLAGYAYFSQSLRVRGLLTACAFFICLSGAARAQSALDGFDPNANDTVRVVVVQPDGKILIGGSFTTLAPNGGATVTRNRIARLNPDGSLDTAFNPDANNVVFAIVVQADGMIVVGGEYTNIGGQTRNRIARLDAVTGAADLSFNPNSNHNVRALALQADGNILVSGQFTNIGGQPRNHVARLYATGIDTGLADLSFNPNVNADTIALVVQADSKILVGGDFTNVGGTPRNYIARLNANGTLDAAFAPNANNIIRSIAVQTDGKILAGGNFTSIGATMRNYIARLDTAGTIDLSFNPNPNNIIISIKVQADGKILAGGSFTSIGGQLRNYIARLDAATGLADSFHPNPNSNPLSLALQADGKILTGSDFTTFAPNGGAAVTRNRIARLERDGTLDQTLNLNAVGSVVQAIAVQPDGKILIGGHFTSILGVARNYIARLNADGTLDTAFNPNANDFVNAIFVQADGSLLVGGHFTNISGQPRGRIARLDATTGAADLTFNPNANNVVKSFVLQADGKILTEGEFTTIGGQTRHFIARLDPVTGAADSFNPNPNNIVLTIALQVDDKILVGGEFSNIGGQPRNHIARLDPVTGLADSFNPNTNRLVYGVITIAVQPDDKILAGGDFTLVGGQTRNNIVRLNMDGTLDATFNPNANDRVLTIVLQEDNKILVGGEFTSIGGQVRHGIARLNTTDGLADSFNPNANNQVYAIALRADGKILAGGRFSIIGEQTETIFARLTNDTAALESLAVTQNSVTWMRDGSSPQLMRVVFEKSTDGVNYTFLGNGTNSFASLASGKGESQFAPAASNWTLTGLMLPTGQNIYIRARGFYRTGFFNGSESITESVRNVFLIAPTAASVSVSGRVLAGKGYGVGKAIVSLTDSGGVRTTITNPLGYYRFDAVEVGQTYVISVSSKSYQFEPQVVSVMEDVGDLNFTALP
jgi:uncharacterized delta-60 repeat protein